MKLLTVVVSLVFLAGKSDLKPIVEKEVCSNGWKQMGSEKCFKLLEVFESWQGAHDLCSDLADGQNKSTLATIHSEQEQKFIRDWLYEEKGVEDIVWIGAKRVNSVSEFRWIDDTPVNFNNFYRSPSQRGDCVEMLPKSLLQSNKSEIKDEDLAGKWKNAVCTKHNMALCEMILPLSLEQLHKKFVMLEEKVNEIEKRAQNKAPLGMIYMQYPNQLIPSAIWECSEGQWIDISKEYAGLFFRVLGRDSNAFGNVQNDSAPQLKEVDRLPVFELASTEHNMYTTVFPVERREFVNLPKKGGSAILKWVSFFNPRDYYMYDRENYGLRFEVSKDEVRPKNKAVKVWKCSDKKVETTTQSK